jgi:hypothetical protein
MVVMVVLLSRSRLQVRAYGSPENAVGNHAGHDDALRQQ